MDKKERVRYLMKNMHEVSDLKDTSLIPAVIELVKETEDPDERQKLYLILNRLGKTDEKIPKRRITEFLMDHLKAEKDEDLRYSIVDVLGSYSDYLELSEDYDPRPVIKFLGGGYRKDIMIRSAAFNVLSRCKSRLTEKAFEDIIKSSKSSDDISEALGGLMDIESRKALVHAKRLVGHKDPGVASMAVYVLRELGDSSLLPVFIDAMKRKGFLEKWEATKAIVKHGDISAVDVICDRVETILARKRKVSYLDFMKSDDKPELIIAIVFLDRYSKENERIMKLFKKIREKKWKLLFDYEQKWLKENIPFFKDIEA